MNRAVRGAAWLGATAGARRAYVAWHARRDRRAANARVRQDAIENALERAHPSAEGHVAVVIAALDEETAIAAVLASLPAELLSRPVEVIVVDDGSVDATAKVASEHGAVVARHERNLGQGDALRTAVAVALARGAEVVVTMDADGQHAAADLPALVGPVLEGRADYVQGSRFLGRYDDEGSFRDAGIRVFTWTINRLRGTSISDCSNGFRAIRAEGLRCLRLSEDRFSAAEIIMEAHHHDLRMLEVPVHIHRRTHGESRKPGRLGYPLGFMRVVLGVRARQLVESVRR